MQQAAILEALPTYLTVVEGQHSLPLCLALFTGAAGNKGFIAIGDWIRASSRPVNWPIWGGEERYRHSTIRRMLLNLDYRVYSECLAKFFGIEPRGKPSPWMVKYCGVPINWKLITNSESHPAIMLVRLTGGARFDSGTLWGGCQN